MTKFKKKEKPILASAGVKQEKERKLPTTAAPFKWKPGQSGNPAGRSPGSRNKFAEAFIKDFLADWEVAGATAIQMCRLEDPSTYLRVAATLIPKELNIKEGESILEKWLEQFTPEQLDQLAASLTTAGIAHSRKPQENKALPRSKPNGVH